MAELELQRLKAEHGVSLIEVLVSLIIFSFAIGTSSEFISSSAEYHKTKVDLITLSKLSSQVKQRVLHSDPASSPLTQKVYPNPFPDLTKLDGVKKISLFWESNNLQRNNAKVVLITNGNEQLSWKIFLPNSNRQKKTD
jgi:prepilin-type N-terminal cleavage/methylation domain-containing protein